MKGSFVARAAAGFPFALYPGLRVALAPPQMDVPRAVTVEAVSSERRDSAVVAFAEVADARTADALVGCHCLARMQDVPDAPACAGVPQAGFGLAGWTLVDADAAPVGTVLRVDENPAQPLLAVETAEGAEALVPLVDDFVLDVDEGARRIRMDLPAGLLDL